MHLYYTSYAPDPPVLDLMLALAAEYKCKLHQCSSYRSSFCSLKYFVRLHSELFSSFDAPSALLYLWSSVAVISLHGFHVQGYIATNLCDKLRSKRSFGAIIVYRRLSERSGRSIYKVMTSRSSRTNARD